MFKPVINSREEAQSQAFQEIKSQILEGRIFSIPERQLKWYNNQENKSKLEKVQDKLINTIFGR